MAQRTLRIATRSSRLALWQANHVSSLLQAADSGCRVELVEVTTTGDVDRTQPLAEMGGVGVFTREVQRAVLDGRADVAVHSLKDLPTEPVEGLTLGAVPERASRYDALVLPAGRETPAIDPGGPTSGRCPLACLSQQARVGTGSLRRQAQLLHQRADLQVENVRGNVETRLQKLDDGEFDAIVLAVAGLTRLEHADRISVQLKPPLLFPAVGQGALGIECRADDEAVQALLRRIDNADTRAAVVAERTMLAALRAGCHAPVGIETLITGDTLHCEAVVLSADGRQRITAPMTGDVAEADLLGHELAADLLELGARALIEA